MALVFTFLGVCALLYIICFIVVRSDVSLESAAKKRDAVAIDRINHWTGVGGTGVVLVESKREREGELTLLFAGGFDELAENVIVVEGENARKPDLSFKVKIVVGFLQVSA